MLAGLVSLSLVAAPAAQADVYPIQRPGTYRIAGSDRYETSVMLSSATTAPRQHVVYLAGSEAYADGLAAGPAAARAKAPLLLVGKDRLPSVVRDELRRLQPTTVRIVGGASSVSEGVAAEVGRVTGAAVERIAGANRYETAAKLAKGVDRSVERIYVVSGETFADALSAAPAAGRDLSALVLVQKDGLPAESREVLRSLASPHVVVVGGSGTISQETVEKVREAAHGVTLTRISGADRYETSAEVSNKLWGAGNDVVLYASGSSYYDALSGVPTAVLSRAPILLTKATGHPDVIRKATYELAPRTKVTIGGEAVAALEW